MPAESRSESCSWDYGGPTGAAFEGLGFDQRTLNVLLFVPAGMFLVLAVGRWWSGVVLAPIGLALLAAYSLGIELMQLQLARIDRACDVTDMVDNVLGAGVGFVVGVLLLPLTRPWRGRTGSLRSGHGFVPDSPAPAQRARHPCVRRRQAARRRARA